MDGELEKNEIQSTQIYERASFFSCDIVDILVSGTQLNDLVFAYITKWSPK